MTGLKAKFTLTMMQRENTQKRFLVRQVNETEMKRRNKKTYCYA